MKRDPRTTLRVDQIIQTVFGGNERQAAQQPLLCVALVATFG
ncbi:hypothetical protein [Roseiflexus castenholzii]